MRGSAAACLLALLCAAVESPFAVAFGKGLDPMAEVGFTWT